MVEFLKHSVLICRMKTVLKSSIAIIEIEHLSATPVSLSSGNLVDLDYKEGWLTLMFPETVEMTQWLKDPFPDHSYSNDIWPSNLWHSPINFSARHTLFGGGGLFWDAQSQIGLFTFSVHQLSKSHKAWRFLWLVYLKLIFSCPVWNLTTRGVKSCRSSQSGVSENWQSGGQEGLRGKVAENGFNVQVC